MMCRKNHSVLVLAIVFGFGAAASEAGAQEAESQESEAQESEAQEDETPEAEADPDVLVAVPDRPTFSAAAATVPGGHAQLEAGSEFASSGDAATLAFPVLVRLGLAPTFEVRAGLPAPIIPLSSGADTELGALQLGAKVAGQVTEALSLGAMPFFDIAAGSGEDPSFSRSSYGVMGLWGLGITRDLSIGGNLGVVAGPTAEEDAAPRELSYAASLALGYSFGALGLTLEGYTVQADSAVGGSLSAGYAALEHLVIDLYAGAEQGDSTTVFGGVGVTFAR